MPTIQQLASLCASAYSKKSFSKATNKAAERHNNTMSDAGLKLAFVHHPHSADHKTNLRTACYVPNDDKTTGCLVFKGTRFTSFSDLRANWQYLRKGRAQQQVDEAYADIVKALNENPQINFIIAGHSLGAHIAMAAAERLHKEKPNLAERISLLVTFNGLGMRSNLTDEQEKHPLQEKCFHFHTLGDRSAIFKRAKLSRGRPGHTHILPGSKGSGHMMGAICYWFNKDESGLASCQAEVGALKQQLTTKELTLQKLVKQSLELYKANKHNKPNKAYDALNKTSVTTQNIIHTVADQTSQLHKSSFICLLLDLAVKAEKFDTYFKDFFSDDLSAKIKLGLLTQSSHKPGFFCTSASKTARIELAQELKHRHSLAARYPLPKADDHEVFNLHQPWDGARLG